MSLVFVNWIVDNYGLLGFVRMKGILTFITGILLGAMVMNWVSALIMKGVRPNENLTKVSILVVKGELFTSPSKTLFETFEKRFFIFLYKIGLFRKTIEFHNEKRMRAMFSTYLAIILFLLVLGLYLSFSISVLDNDLINQKQENLFIRQLNKVSNGD